MAFGSAWIYISWESIFFSICFMNLFFKFGWIYWSVKISDVGSSLSRAICSSAVFVSHFCCLKFYQEKVDNNMQFHHQSIHHLDRIDQLIFLIQFYLNLLYLMISFWKISYFVFLTCSMKILDLLLHL